MWSSPDGAISSRILAAHSAGVQTLVSTSVVALDGDEAIGNERIEAALHVG